MINEYRADGTVVQHVGGRMPAPLRFASKVTFLIYSVERPDGMTFEQKEEIRLTDDALTSIDSPTSKRVFRRSKQRKPTAV